MPAGSFKLPDAPAPLPRLYLWIGGALMLLGMLHMANCSAVRRSELKPARPMQEPVAAIVQGDGARAQLAKKARQVFDQRCVGCHGCYDAPCQLKLTSFEGMARGGTKLVVYDGARPRAVPPTRLGMDAHDVATWRKMGFHSVLGIPKDKPRALPILRRMLDLKKQHPLPAGIYLPADMKVGIDREHTCPNWEEMADYEREHPLWGMPYALPGLSKKEDAALRAWLDAGAPELAPQARPAQLQAKIDAAESWLNREVHGRELAARYIYEHLFLGSIYFEQGTPTRWFRLIRSSTPPGRKPKEIVTRLSIDPVQGGVYYRFVERDETVLAKTHLSYMIDSERLQRWDELFGGTKIKLAKAQTPDAPKARSNPFRTFSAIPMAARYKFLLDDAGYFLGGFIKGPVCRGQTALNVIQDRFWVVFLNPDSQVSEALSHFLREVHDKLELPAEDGSQNTLVRWLDYAVEHEQYLEEGRRFVRELARAQDTGPRTQESALWKGSGRNPNAALTVFRHHDSATVVQGLLGKDPKTAWLLSYPELERIHYLLVAGFDVFGNIGHQVNTRLYMDFLRMEGEYNFLLLSSQKERKRLVEWWYRDVGGLKQYWIAEHLEKSEIRGAWEDEGIVRVDQVYAKLKKLLAPIDRATQWDLDTRSQDPVLVGLDKIGATPSSAASHFPEVTLILVEGEEPRLFSMLRETAFANVARLMLDQERRRPSEDQLAVFQGVLGAYPNAILRVSPEQVPALVQEIHQTKSASDYAGLLSRFGVRRTNPAFWAVSDKIHEVYARTSPLEYGRLDYNRIENR